MISRHPRGFAARSLALLLTALVCTTSTMAQNNATLKFSSAWMRPAPVSAGSARAYVDIESDTALTLTLATTPVARTVELVVVGPEPTTETVVATMPVWPGKPTRLAFRGNHLRLVGLNRDIGGSESIPVTLHFATEDGRVIRSNVDIVIRGFTASPPPAAGSDPRRP